MRLLLDTHIFLWWVLNDSRLPEHIREAIADPTNRLYLSAASTWEMIIKAGLGKLKLPEPPGALIEKQLRLNATDPLPVTIAHTMYLASLPDLHKDPFDRMLVAQANCEGLTLVTDDAVIRRYPVAILGAAT